MAEDDVLDLEIGGVVGEDQGNSILMGRNEGNAGDTVEVITNRGRGEITVLEVVGHLGCPGVEYFILGSDAVVAELGVWDHIFAGGRVIGGVVEVAVGVDGFETDIGANSVGGDGDGEVQEGEGGVRDGPGEFEVRVKGVGEVDELFELFVGARSSTNTVINVVEEEVRAGANVTAEEGLFHVSHEEAGIARIHTGAHS
eukprot:g30140.t1